MKRILKWDVLVINQDSFIGSGRVVHVGCQFPQNYGLIQVWTEEGEVASADRRVTVVGTGQPYPHLTDVEWEPVGSTIVADGNLVWHVLAETKKEFMEDNNAR